MKWLGDGETVEKEVFLASGEGLGLANVNPLVIELREIRQLIFVASTFSFTRKK